MTAGAFDDDYFQDFFENSNTMRAIRESARKSIEPALELIKQRNAQTVANVMDTLRPTIDAMTSDAPSTFSRIVLPVIAMPKYDFNLGNLGKIKLGDDVARQIVESINYGGVSRDVTAEPEPPVAENAAEFEPEAFTERSLDEMTEALFERHPQLRHKFYNDPKIDKLGAGERKMLAWQWALVIFFGAGLLFGWGQQNDDVEVVTNIVVTTAPYVGGKVLKGKPGEEEDEPDEAQSR